MRKTILILAALTSLAFAAPASAQLVVVQDPTYDEGTNSGAFTGTYTCYETYIDENGEEKQRETTCTQKGYVSVGEDGVVACQGNEEITRPDDGTPLQGYAWVGPANAASNPTGAAPGNVFGAGNNHEDADGEPTGESPCP